MKAGDNCLTPEWWPNWRGETAFVCGAGPSLTRADVERCRGHRVIVTNRSWELAPWADALYACDFRFYAAHDGVPGFSGLKLCQRRNAARRGWGVEFVTTLGGDAFQIDGTARIGWLGGNSGGHAINLAIQFGARRIGLLGFDMTLVRGLHWHGSHGALGDPVAHAVERWRKVLDRAAPAAAKAGVDVVNCTPDSALTAYPKMSVSEALERWTTVPSPLIPRPT